MTELMSLTPGELKEWCLEQGMPGFRAGQLFAWLHKGARFAEMTNLPKPLREQLQATAVDQPVEILTHRRSKLDDTVKFLFGLRDGQPVRLRAEGERAVVFENVIVRSGKGHDMEVHIDTDEANAIAMRGTPMMEVLP